MAARKGQTDPLPAAFDRACDLEISQNDAEPASLGRAARAAIAKPTTFALRPPDGRIPATQDVRIVSFATATDLGLTGP